MIFLWYPEKASLKIFKDYFFVKKEMYFLLLCNCFQEAYLIRAANQHNWLGVLLEAPCQKRNGRQVSPYLHHFCLFILVVHLRWWGILANNHWTLSTITFSTAHSLKHSLHFHFIPTASLGQKLDWEKVTSPESLNTLHGRMVIWASDFPVLAWHSNPSFHSGTRILDFKSWKS